MCHSYKTNQSQVSSYSDEEIEIVDDSISTLENQTELHDNTST